MFPQMFPCEFYDIFENVLFTEHLWTTASVTSFISFMLHLSLFYLCREKMVLIKANISRISIFSEEILGVNPRDYLCNYHFGVFKIWTTQFTTNNRFYFLCSIMNWCYLPLCNNSLSHFLITLLHFVILNTSKKTTKQNCHTL